MPGHSLRALALFDGDGDGDRDVLAVASPERGVWSLWFARREGERFEAPVRLGRLGPPNPACTTAEARWHASGQRLQVEARHRCPQGEVTSLALLSWRETPRWEERLDADPPDITVPWRIHLAGDPSHDADGDGHPDWTVTVTVAPAPTEGTRQAEPPPPSRRLQLVWLDRPAGLAPRPDAVADWMRSQRKEVATLRREAPLRAARLEQTLLGARDALCRRGPGARLLVSDVRGLPCPGTLGLLPRLFGRLVLDLLAAKRWEEALDVEARGEARGITFPDALRDESSAAWDAVVADRPTRWRPLRLPSPPEPLPDAPGQPATLGFLDEHTLRFCASPLAPPRFLDLRGEPFQPTHTPAPCGGPLPDPSGRLGARSPERDCWGYFVEVVTLGGDATVQARPRIEERPPPPGTRCPAAPLPEHLAHETGGWKLLGWSPQGLLVVRGDEVRVLPLTDAGRPAGAPLRLGTERPLPVPIYPPGPAAPDGTATVRITRRGVLVRPRRPGAPARLLRPQGWDEARLPSAAAVGPKGDPVAVVRAGRPWLIEERPTEAPTPPQPAEEAGPPVRREPPGPQPEPPGDP